MRLTRALWNSASKVAAATSQTAKTEKFLDFYSQFNPSPLSIKQFIDFGEYVHEFRTVAEVMAGRSVGVTVRVV